MRINVYFFIFLFFLIKYLKYFLCLVGFYERVQVRSGQVRLSTPFPHQWVEGAQGTWIREPKRNKKNKMRSIKISVSTEFFLISVKKVD